MHTSNQTNSASSYEREPTVVSVIPVKVQFRHMAESKRVVWLVNQMMDKFSKFPMSGSNAEVVVDETHHRESKSIFQVKMKLSVPGERLYVAQSFEKPGMHDGVYSAIADVFDCVERQLIKHHEKRSKRRVQKVYEDAA